MITLKVLIDGYFLYRNRSLAKTTRENYRYAFTRLAEYIGEDRLVDAITATDIDDYLSYLRTEGLSERSIADNYAICSTLWTFAADELKVPHIVKEVERPDYTDREINCFTEAECKALVRHAEWTRVWSSTKGKPIRSHRPTWLRDVALIVLLLDTGMRVSEACNLKVNDYNNETGRLLIRVGKGGKERSVFLGEAGQRSLWRYIISRTRLKPTDPLLVTVHNKPMHRSYLYHMFKRIGDVANVPDAHPHRCRHTFAVQWLRNGGNIYELQRILGHADLETVKIYLHLSEVDLQRAQQSNSPADNWGL